MIDCDYLVIGAGAAGCVIAARLSERPENRVVLVEAGGEDRSWLLRLPGAAFLAAGAERFNWNFETEPVAALNGRKLVWLAGKVLGGSSSINGMIYTRGHSREYDLWRQMGCTGWGFDDVLPFFRRSEGHERGDGPWHGGSGPLKVRRARPDLPICDAFLAAAAEAGFPVLEDLNQDTVDGFGFYDLNIDRGFRASTAAAFLGPARSRANLTVLTGAPALRVLIENGRARGAEILVNGRAEHIMAAGEVIVSAGGIKSPQLLMLSGIGPAEDLRRQGIPVVVDSPRVGRNLQNHASYRPRYRCSAPVTGRRHLDPWRAMAAGLSFATTRRGALAESFATAGGFFRTDPRLETPDAQVVLISALPQTGTLGPARLRDLLPREHGFAMTIYQGSPNSRGQVALRSADPLAPPWIETGYFSDPRDIEVLADAVERMRELVRRPALGRYVSEELQPGAEVRDRAGLIADIRRNAATSFHPCGTCAMGSQPDSVVTPTLSVRGIEGLRVADASIIPRIPNAALHAPVIMIAEKAASMVMAS